MPSETIVVALKSITHIALRPIKYLGKLYHAGDHIALDEKTAASLGSTAVEPYSVPVAAMTADELKIAATEAAAREKAAKAAGATS